MKKIIFTLITLIMLSGILIAQDVLFQEGSRDIAKDVQGTIYKLVNGQWIQYQEDNIDVTITIYSSNPDPNHPGETATVTPVSGNYSHDFNDSEHNHEYYDKIKIIFASEVYITDYYGRDRIDIYWDGNSIVAPPTDPNDD